VERCGPGDVEVWRYGAPETRCSRVDVGVWSSGDLQERCSPGTRYGGMELWSCGDELQARRSEVMEV